MEFKKNGSNLSSVWALLLGLLLVVSVQPIEGSEGSPQNEKRPAQADYPSRTEELLQKRQQRLAKVKPAKASKTIGFLASLENDGFDQMFTTQWKHWLVGFGKVSPLSGFTPGIGYQRPRLGGTPLNLKTGAAYSVSGYQVYSAQFGFADQTAPYDMLGSAYLGAPFDFDQRRTSRLDKFLYGEVRYRNFPREEFYGVGPDSQEGNRSDYRLEESLVDLVAGYQPARWLGLEGRAGYMPTHVGVGTNDRLSNVQDLFDDETAPGLENPPDFMHFDVGLYLGWLPDPHKPSAQMGFRVARYNSINDDRFDFTRFSADARGYLTLGCRQRVIAVRGYVSRDFGESGFDTPFYMMKTLGGEETLRGFRNLRFRDKNLAYLSSEYRWEASPAVELAFFYDTGKVFPDRGGFSFDHLRHSFGAGLRWKGERWPILRFDVGRSEEGTFLYIAMGPAF